MERRKTTKLKQRVQSQKEVMMKLGHDVGIRRARYESSSKEGVIQVNAGELTIHIPELGSRTASTSSSVKAGTDITVSSQHLSPAASLASTQSATTEYHPAATKNIMNMPPLLSKQSLQTEYHLSSSKNIMNLLPPQLTSTISIAESSNIEALNIIHHYHGLQKRSASMSDIGRVVREQLPKHDVLHE